MASNIFVIKWLFPFLLLVKGSYGVIYSLNESEYSRMPPLYKLDDFKDCMFQPGGLFCLTDVSLYSDRPSELLDMIKEYSADTKKHYNHTHIHRGVCVTKTCKSFVSNTTDLTGTLAACINNSLWQDYQLQGVSTEIDHCYKEGEKSKIDLSDFIMLAVYIVIVIVNALGTAYDLILCKDGGDEGNPLFLAFSLRRNWKRLTAPNTGDTEPRLNRLKLFYGLRTLTMVCVFLSHTSLLMAFTYIENPLFVETTFDDITAQIMLNGSLVTHTFFVMSAFLLAYNIQIAEEKHPITWSYFPKGIFYRWIRLTPPYALILFTISTWMRHLGTGPLWHRVVISEADACRTYWWSHLTFINNYIYKNANCMPATWYLAADMQLFVVGITVAIAARTKRAQKIALSILFVISLITPALHTYFDNLDAVVIQSPESYLNFYGDNHTFRTVYISGHTNLATYTIGLAGGFLTYYLQKEGYDFSKYKSYRWVVWLMVPLGVLMLLTGGVFYRNGVELHIIYRVLYAATYKPVFQSIEMIIIISCIFKFENVYRRLVEWRGFTVTGRVSYSAFLIHTLLQRAYFGILTTTFHATVYSIIIVLFATTVISFSLAALVWLLIEAPMTRLLKAVLTPPRRHLEKNMAAAEAGDGQTKF